MPQYKVTQKGYIDRIYQPGETLHRDLPYKKSELPSWLKPVDDTGVVANDEELAEYQQDQKQQQIDGLKAQQAELQRQIEEAEQADLDKADADVQKADEAKANADADVEAARKKSEAAKKAAATRAKNKAEKEAKAKVDAEGNGADFMGDDGTDGGVQQL